MPNFLSLDKRINSLQKELFLSNPNKTRFLKIFWQKYILTSKAIKQKAMLFSISFQPKRYSDKGVKIDCNKKETK